MKIVDVRDPCVPDLVIDELGRSAVVLQLPPVYVLLAAPTAAGVGHLNHVKQRLTGKNYGTALGSFERFWACVDRSDLPPEVDRDAMAGLVGAFVRCRFADDGFDSAVIRGGTHQGVLLPDPWRALFTAVEEAYRTRAEPALWGGHAFTAPLCTSFNQSGHPDGSIVDRDVALRFAEERGMGLFVTCEERATAKGSYPIFAFGRGGVTVERQGPRLDELLAQLPASLRPAA